MDLSALLHSSNVWVLIPLVAIVGGLVVGALKCITNAWYSSRQAELDAALKQDMLNRGMSAAEIERVINAGTSHRTNVTDT